MNRQDPPGASSPDVSDACAWLLVDGEDELWDIVPRYMRRLAQWRVKAPPHGLPGDEAAAGMRIPLGYALLRLNRAPMTERYPVVSTSHHAVEDVGQWLASKGISGVIPVVKARAHYDDTKHPDELAYVCWLDREQLTRLSGATQYPVRSTGAKVDLPSGEQLADFYPDSDGSTRVGSAPRRRADIWVMDRPYKRLFSQWAEPPGGIEVEGRHLEAREGIAWPIAATPDGFSRKGEAIVRITKGDANKQDLNENQLVVVRPVLVPEYGHAIAAVASLRLIDQAPDDVPAHYLEVDQVVRDAIGVEIGENVVIEGQRTQRIRLFDPLLGPPTYVMCRVQSADAFTIEREIGLMDALTLELIGVESGDEVVIEGIPTEGTAKEPDGKLPSVQVKGFGVSDDVLTRRLELSGGDLACRFPSSRDALGVYPDLPWVFLDSATRAALGLAGGKLGVVRIRASSRYQLVKELREILLIVAIAVIGILSLFNGKNTRIILVALLFLGVASVIFLRMRHRLSRRLKPPIEKLARRTVGSGSKSGT